MTLDPQYAILENTPEWESLLCYIPSRKQIIHTVNTRVKYKWKQLFRQAAPTGDHVIKSLLYLNGDWTLIPAKSICHTDNGFSSGVVSIGDCVWIEKDENETYIIQLTHVCLIFWKCVCDMVQKLVDYNFAK